MTADANHIAGEVTPSVHGEPTSQPAPVTSAGAGTITIADLYSALDQVTRYAANEPGSGLHQQATMVARMLPHIVNGLIAAMIYRSHGHHRPSEYDGYTAITVEVPTSIEETVDAIIRKIRP